MVVYGDLLFLINFSMDYLCFYFSSLLLHRKMPYLRALLASSIGGVYSVLALFLYVQRGLALIIDISVLILMCLIVNYQRGMGIWRIIKAILMYFLVSALLGGIMTALFSLFNELEIFADALSLKEGIDVWIFALLAILGSVFTVCGGRLFRSSSSMKTATLTLKNGDKSAEIRALVDSGNLSVEPISGRSVIFVYKDACLPLINDKLRMGIERFLKSGELSSSDGSGIHLVPGRTVAGSTLLPAIRIESVSVKIGDQAKELDVYIGITESKPTSECDAIISHEAII